MVTIPKDIIVNLQGLQNESAPNEKILEKALADGWNAEASATVSKMSDGDLAKLNPALRKKLIEAFDKSIDSVNGAPIDVDTASEAIKGYEEQIKRLNATDPKNVVAGMKEQQETDKKLDALLEKGLLPEAVEKIIEIKDSDLTKLNPKLKERLIKNFKEAAEDLENASPQYDEVSERLQQYKEQAERLERFGGAKEMEKQPERAPANIPAQLAASSAKGLA